MEIAIILMLCFASAMVGYSLAMSRSYRWKSMMCQDLANWWQARHREVEVNPKAYPPDWIEGAKSFSDYVQRWLIV